MRLLNFIVLFLPQVFWAQESHFIEADGHTVHFRLFGMGEPLLIINGGPGMSSNGFENLAKDLAKDRQTILYDQRGTGLSKMAKIDAASMTMDLLVQDLESLRKHLNLEKWTILGHSFGGMLAYAYAAKYPERVKAMIQSSSGGMDLSILSDLDISTALTPIERDSLQYYRIKIATGDNTHATLLKRGEFLAPAYVFDRKHIPEIAERLTQVNTRISSMIWDDLQQKKFDTKGDMKDFTKPVLIINGAEDIVGLEIPQTAHDVLPNSKLIILPQTRHYGWLDAKVEYFDAISDFLKSL
ncbi:alpha/beta fold hydrolase [Salinimicrobium soli]